MKRTLHTLGLATMLAGTLAPAPPASAAFVSLPSNGAQVNDDAANSIDPKQDAGLVDVAGGTVVAGNVQVPWATFEQKLGDSQQIFVRAFKNGAWVTQGVPASLNIDPTVEAEAPSIDFAGAGRTVPWVAWYEPNVHFGDPTNIFASRFNAGANRWLSSGQDRADGAGIPSLNIHTNRTAENPSVAGGATVAGNDPVPWIIWEENDGTADDAYSPRQIFVSKGVKQQAAGTPCTGFKPSEANNLNGFCFQQVGLERLASGQSTPRDATVDPTLNIDPTRVGLEPDIAFTGQDHKVVWTVWYEEGASAVPGLRSNEMVFAAKAVANAAADGGFQWVAVGNGTAGQTNVLDRSGAHHFGSCAESDESEDACSLNADNFADAENPRVAAGTLTPGQPTVPWVVWDEDIGGGRHTIFISRLVGGDHFELFKPGQPISNRANDARRPDITFAGNVPYISWQERVGTSLLTFVGHFEGGAAAPRFKLDTPGGIAASTFADVDNPQRAPISSTCTANPTNADGAACQGGAIGTPFFLFTAGAPGSQKLFADAFAPSDVRTLAASDETASSATLHGIANPGGTRAPVHFDFGPTAAYGSSSTAETLGVSVVPRTFDALASGLANGSTIHYRAVAASDFATVAGSDATVTIVNQPPVVAMGDLETELHLRDLGRQRTLSLALSIDEPATVTIQLLNKKHKVVRQTTVTPSSAGAFVAALSLKHVHPGKFTLHVLAVDSEGATSVPIDLALRVRR
ncbi:MAG: hypothetical protein E6J71_22385 [Deltaproteobacteria bacterium]|nr:MAG: hypothetical protein E6J71_22385 [Deltaproteobacteria bacterium]